MVTKHILYIGTAGAAIALLSATPACAQTAPAADPAATERASDRPIEQGDIVVTAQKRSERALDVPIALTAIDATALAQQNITQLKDYFTRIPGLNLNGRNSGLSTLAIRGITTGAGTNPTVAVTVDDIPYGSASSAGYGDQITLDLDPSDLSRIEVLKGPQGTLYGASSLGGLVKYVTTDPDTTAISGRIQADGSTVAHGGEGYGLRGAINLPIVTDTLAIRASAFHRRDPGFIDNVVSRERDANDGTAEGGRLALLWRPDAQVSIKIAALLQNSRADDAATFDVTNLAFVPQFGPYAHSRIPGTDSFSNRARLYTAVAEFDLGRATLTSLTGYADNRYAGFSDVSGTFGRFAEIPGSGITLLNRIRSKRFTQEVRIASTGTNSIDWLAGVFFTKENTPSFQTFNEVTPATGGVRALLGDYVYRFHYREIAGFGDATVHITPRFDVQVGARYAENKQRYDETGVGPLDGNYSIPTRRASGSALTWLVTPRLRFGADAMAYLRVASGYRPGGFNSNASVAVPESFKPDRTINYELGVKGNFLDRLLTVEGDLFWIDWTDIQLLQRDATGNSYYANGGRARSRGAELQATVRPAAGLTIAGATTFTDAKLTQDVIPAIYGFKGDRLPYSPRWASTLAVDQRVPVGGSVTGVFGATVAYVGERRAEFTSRANQPRVGLPGFTTYDLRAGVEVDDWQIQLFAKNLTDKRGFVSGVARDTIAKQAPYQIALVTPRTIGLSISRGF